MFTMPEEVDLTEFEELNAFEPRCVVCSDFLSYCLGHGDAGGIVWDAHDEGDHSMCDKDACWSQLHR